MIKTLLLMTILIGLLGVLLKPNLLLKILAMDVMSTGIISLFVLAASRTGNRTPTVIPNPPDTYADPLPQAVVLTAIVIGFSVLAVLLVCATTIAKRYPTLNAKEIERHFDR
jgi:multicomponent Na+:H+ antiporter subunit C